MPKELCGYLQDYNETVGTFQFDSLHAMSQTVTSPLTLCAICDGSVNGYKCPICGTPMSVEGFNLKPEFMFGTDRDRLPDFEICVSPQKRKKLIRKLSHSRGIADVCNIGVKFEDGVMTYAEKDKA